MPRFTIKDLLLATTLIAIGVGMLAQIFSGTSPDWIKLLGDSIAVAVCILIWLGSGALIGAGLFSLFKHPWIRAAVGFLFQFVFFILLFSLAFFYE